MERVKGVNDGVVYHCFLLLSTQISSYNNI